MHFFQRQKKFRLKDIDAGHHRVTYKGVRAKKNPFDYLLYQMITWEVKPDLIIEIGTNKGGSTLYLADLLELTQKGEVHSIDLESNAEDPLLYTHPRIHLFKNGFREYDTELLKSFQTILVIEDGSHMYEDSLDALKIFSPFVTKGSYYIVEDGIITELGLNKEYNGGPQKAVAEFLETNENFTIDKKWCDFFGPSATFNINGYLKRIA
ncbi:MAG TPA: CmcI family methyltransferase [Chitinophagaceae bacterium]